MQSGPVAGRSTGRRWHGCCRGQFVPVYPCTTENAGVQGGPACRMGMLHTSKQGCPVGMRTLLARQYAFQDMGVFWHVLLLWRHALQHNAQSSMRSAASSRVWCGPQKLAFVVCGRNCHCGLTACACAHGNGLCVCEMFTALCVMVVFACYTKGQHLHTHRLLQRWAWGLYRKGAALSLVLLCIWQVDGRVSVDAGTHGLRVLWCLLCMIVVSLGGSRAAMGTTAC